MTTLAPAAVATTPEVVGKAVYLEAIPVLDAEGKPVISWYGSGNSVKQIIIFPAGMDNAGRKVQPTIYDRTVSKSYPKAQWSNTTIQPMPSKSEFRIRGEESYRGLVVESPTPAELEAMPEEIQQAYLTNSIEKQMFSELMYEKSTYDPETGNYKVEAIPAWTVTRKFTVEVTDKDLADVRGWKTPQAVIRRITKVRVSLGLPEKLF